MYPKDSHFEMGVVLWTVVALYHSLYGPDDDLVLNSPWYRNVIAKVDDDSFDTTVDVSSQPKLVEWTRR